MTTAPNIFPAFAVPMAEVRYPRQAALNPRLESLILRMEAEGDTHRNVDAVVHQPPGLFESNFDFFAVDDDAVQELQAFCWQSLGSVIQGLNSALADGLGGVEISSHTWFHVTREGGYFDFHNHPMASWSGVYCVSNGEPDPSIKNNGALVFAHPNPAISSFVDVANSTMAWPYSHGNFVVNLEPGVLILFPSWLGHYVAPFKGRRPRITVAFNTWFRRG